MTITLINLTYDKFIINFIHFIGKKLYYYAKLY